MATAIDFEALMREEMAKAISENRLKAKVNGEFQTEEGQGSSGGVVGGGGGGGGGGGKQDGGGVVKMQSKPRSWQDIPDPAFEMGAERSPVMLESFKVGTDRYTCSSGSFPPWKHTCAQHQKHCSPAERF
jgi:hypothetical protein